MPISVVIFFSAARPRFLAGADRVSASGAHLFSAARAARRLAWPLREREAFRQADGRADYFLQPPTVLGSRGVRGKVVLSVEAVADLFPNPSGGRRGTAGLSSDRPAQ